MLNSAVASFPDSFCIVKVIFLLKGSVPHQAVSTRCGNKTPKSLFPLAEPPPNLFHYTWKGVKPLVQHLFVSSLIVIQFPPPRFCPVSLFLYFSCSFNILAQKLLFFFFFPIYVTTHHCGVACSLFISKVLYCGNRLMKPPLVKCRSSYRLQFILLCLCILVKPNLMQVKFIMQHFAL